MKKLRMMMKKVVFLAVLLSLCFSLSTVANAGWLTSGSGNASKNSPDALQSEHIRKTLLEALIEIGMPNIVNWQQLKMMKTIYELCDQEKLICDVYIVSDYQGKLIHIGKCMGYGVPFSAQYTNPSRVYDAEKEGGVKGKTHDAGEVQVLPQADPNGLFMPVSSDATWLNMIDPRDNSLHVVYFEPKVVVSPFPLHK